MLIGNTFYSFFIGSVTNIIAEMDLKAAELNSKVAIL